jgi:hypothetical protein
LCDIGHGWHRRFSIEVTHIVDKDDPAISTRTIIAAVSLGIGAFLDLSVFYNQPPFLFLIALFCLFLVFDSLDGAKNRIKRLEAELDTILEKMKEL